MISSVTVFEKKHQQQSCSGGLFEAPQLQHKKEQETIHSITAGVIIAINTVQTHVETTKEANKHARIYGGERYNYVVQSTTTTVTTTLADQEQQHPQQEKLHYSVGNKEGKVGREGDNATMKKEAAIVYVQEKEVTSVEVAKW
mmetsp:Transcript_7361/g.7219  ORF Transcript_7361/g.7219 Transcript_7361/m.7219 type:complete len:143 (+) Transcript_7361:99-527(+)